MDENQFFEEQNSAGKNSGGSLLEKMAHLCEVDVPAGNIAAIAATLSDFMNEDAKRSAPGLYDEASAYIVGNLTWSNTPINGAMHVWALLPESEARKDEVIAGLIEVLAAELCKAPEGKGVPMPVLSAWERLDGEKIERTATSPLVRKALDNYHQAYKNALPKDTQKSPRPAEQSATTVAAPASPAPAVAHEQSNEPDEQKRSFWILEDFRKGHPMLPSMQQRLETLRERSQTLMIESKSFQENFQIALRQKIWECLNAKNDPDARRLGLELCQFFSESERLERNGIAHTVAQLRLMFEQVPAQGSHQLAAAGQVPNTNTKAPPPILSQNQQQKHSARYGEKYTWKNFAIEAAVVCAIMLAVVLAIVFAQFEWLKSVGFLCGVLSVLLIAIRHKWAKQGYRD
ncbi:MAG: hypothetical protein LBJ12_00870 [Oscillospiraceae bacterium]|jgi:hypothetical protein|nr:hypothetical protein [Oscillospiraceae bacterium]